MHTCNVQLNDSERRFFHGALRLAWLLNKMHFIYFYRNQIYTVWQRMELQWTTL